MTGTFSSGMPMKALDLLADMAERAYGRAIQTTTAAKDGRTFFFQTEAAGGPAGNG
jgi:hypothetical protein